jgi:flavoprotein family protein
MRLAIIGGGASGLMCASFLKRNNSRLDITIYERNKGLGRKILASGNGKCNFMNYKASIYDYNHPEFVSMLFKQTSKDEVLNYFSSLGLLFKFDDEGKMYPQTESSDTILKLLTDDLKNINIKLDSEVFSLEYKNDKVIINHNDSYDYAILASGSSAGILANKAKNIYSYYDSLSLKKEALRPVLVGFRLKEDVSALQGYRTKCKISYEAEGLYEEKGEVIFKADGISGICIMNASRYFLENALLKIDLYPGASKEEIEYALNVRKRANNDPHYYLDGICHPKMIDYLIKNKITDPALVSGLLKCFILTTKSTYDIPDAQVLRGGISLEEVSSSLSLKKYPHLFVTGEAMDIDGMCGGYNLLFAFLCGMHVGKELIKIENKNN